MKTQKPTVKLPRGNYRIVGLGVQDDDTECRVSGKIATGYILYRDTMVPVDLKLFGPGVLGEEAAYPKE